MEGGTFEGTMKFGDRNIGLGAGLFHFQALLFCLLVFWLLDTSSHILLPLLVNCR